MSAASPTLEHVLAALQALYHDPDTQAKKRANEWLEEFQHSVDAWQTCHELLSAEGSPLEGRLFAAQTLRAKITYDLHQLPRPQLPPLRDSILASLSALSGPSAPTGSRAVIVQLNLALSDLALQMHEWTDVVGGMVDKYGQDPGTVLLLLGFLKCLVEESGNPRLPISGSEASQRIDEVITSAGEQVINLLAMYVQAAGITTAIQIAVFDTLRSWLLAGELLAPQIVSTPLFTAAFDALVSDELFDSAVDVLCDMIHETQEISDNVGVIQQIVPRLVATRAQMEEHQEDPDRIRGYCRLFSEAGECYKDLIVRHTDELLPLVQAIAACAAYPDLDIVPITFNFWYFLATTLGRQPTDPTLRPILDIYASLQTVIISHLRFPNDNEAQTAQERDEFRTFRHRMGDTLKDCCHVLGAPTCLRKSYDLVVEAMQKPSPSWQEIEAPLFSMRSMGAEVDPDDDEVLPHIMALLPTLPDHPRIRYAAILVISRYTQWIDRHPQNLAFQLEYISSGFNLAQEEVSAAAAQAMKFMCQDCSRHLVPFLPQLHAFIGTVGDKLDQSDLVEVSEAIGYVISGMEAAESVRALQQFAEPLIARVQAVVAMADPQKADLQRAADAMEQLDALVQTGHTGRSIPESCYPTASQIWGVLDSLLSRYAKLFYISERVGSLIRRGLKFFPPAAIAPIIQQMLDRMTSCFEETGYPSYLWITGKLASTFSEQAVTPGGEALAGLLLGALARETEILRVLCETKSAVEIPDVMDDYVHCASVYFNKLPSQTFSLPTLHVIIQLVISSLSCPLPETQIVTLQTLKDLAVRCSDPSASAVLLPIFRTYGKPLLTLVLNGLIRDFPEEAQGLAPAIVGIVCAAAPQPGSTDQWVAEIMADVPGHLVPAEAKAAFLEAIREVLAAGPTAAAVVVEDDGRRGKVSQAVNGLVRAARRARERGRQARKSLGAGM